LKHLRVLKQRSGNHDAIQETTAKLRGEARILSSGASLNSGPIDTALIALHSNIAPGGDPSDGSVDQPATDRMAMWASATG